MRLRVTDTAERLDRFLLRHLWQGTGRRRAADLLALSAVRVNGRPARKGTLVHPGDEVTIEPVPEDCRSGIVKSLPPAVVYADARLIAIDKPPGIPSVAGRGAGPTAEAMVRSGFPAMRGGGLVHRLDTGTSGLLLAAQTPECYQLLRLEFSRKTIRKTYVAVVHGRLLRAGSVSHPLRRRARGRSRVIPAKGSWRTAWPAHTEYEPLRQSGDLTLVRLRMRTGVTHQLRVHMAMLGYPILGDQRYGSEHVGIGWHYLHAAALAFDSGEWPRALATAFPHHWKALFADLGWSVSWETEICNAP